MIAALGWALAACDPAGAAPSPASGLAAPAGWQALPPMAQAARDSLGSGITIEGVEAWGEPARGCYAVWLAASTAGDATKLAEDFLGGLTSLSGSTGSASSGLVVRDVVKPTAAEGLLHLQFTREAFTGKLAARLGGGRIDALACFANRREPGSCESACTTLLGAIR